MCLTHHLLEQFLLILLNEISSSSTRLVIIPKSYSLEFKYLSISKTNIKQSLITVLCLLSNTGCSLNKASYLPETSIFNNLETLSPTSKHFLFNPGSIGPLLPTGSIGPLTHRFYRTTFTHRFYRTTFTHRFYRTTFTQSLFYIGLQKFVTCIKWFR